MGAHFINLEPRYTPGSPGAVMDTKLAERVALQEKEHYHAALSGVYGQEYLDTAKTKGLSLIVFEMKETSKGWQVYDFITKEQWLWPMTASCPKCRARKVRCIRGHLGEHTRPKMKGDRYLFQCEARDFVGKMLND